MKNALIALLAVGLVVVAVYAYVQTAALKTEVQELNAKLAARSAADTMDLQAKCTKQAVEAFRWAGLEGSKTATYRSHYSVALGKCFVQTSDSIVTEDSFRRSVLVIDAFELKHYGEYLQTSSRAPKPGGLFTDCRVVLPSGEAKTCGSAGEFLELVRPYMER